MANGTMNAATSTVSNYLVFGGNGFIGFNTLCRLFKTLSDGRCPHTVTLVNRGRSWDWDKTERIKEHLASCEVRSIRCNRKKPLSECEELIDFVQSTETFRAVIDFSAYKTFEMGEAVQLVGHKCSLYVYISTDSVYEVCVEKQQRSDFTVESDAVRPSSRENRKTMNRRDRYGHNKLKCEELLTRYSRQRSNFSYVVLRLADVIGQYDCTHRLWQCVLWAQLSSVHGLPICLPSSSQSQQVSLCYVNDVASLVVDICCNWSADNLDTIRNECFNLACVDTITVGELFRIVHDKLQLVGLPDVQFVNSAAVTELFPSVTRGPVDVTKAVASFGWKPTCCNDAVGDTVLFYRGVMHQSNFQKEKLDCMNELLSDARSLYPKTSLKCLRRTLLNIMNIPC